MTIAEGDAVCIAKHQQNLRHLKLEHFSANCAVWRKVFREARTRDALRSVELHGIILGRPEKAASWAVFSASVLRGNLVGYDRCLELYLLGRIGWTADLEVFWGPMKDD